MYIVFDLDDTLLKNDKTISDYTLKRLKYFQEKGHFLVINSARNIYRTKSVIEVLKPDYSILDGGSIILDKDMNLIYDYPFDYETINSLILDMCEFCIEVCVQTYKQLYAINKDYKSQGALFRDFNVDPIKNGEGVYKIIFVPSDTKRAYELKDKYNIEVFNYLNGKWFRSNPLGITKYFGIERLLEITSGKREDVIAFGDDYSDLDMILKSYHGVAMANSVESILSQAKNIALSNEEDGVVKYLNYYLGEKDEENN